MADPYTSTREQFTTHLTSKPTPSGAAPEWAKLANNLKELLDKLAHHSAMAPNLQQTYMTPANSKNHAYVYMVPPDLQDLSTPEEEKWEDAKGRAVYAKQLMCDDMPGMLNMMTESTYPGQKGAHPAFGEELLEIARRFEA